MTAQSTTILRFPELRSDCGRCSKVNSCIGLGLDRDSPGAELSLNARTRVLHKHEKLVNDGDSFHALYAVRAGAIKTYKTTETGEEQIIDFCLPGDLIGLDAIHSGRFQCHAVALDTSSVCSLEFNELQHLCERSPAFLKVFLKRMSAGIMRNENLLVTLGTRDAYQRLAAFLVMLTEYYGDRGYSRFEFALPMSRIDIADYLNLAVETVSRLFSRLQAEHRVKVRRNAMTVVDLDGLYQAAGMTPPPHAPRVGAR